MTSNETEPRLISTPVKTATAGVSYAGLTSKVDANSLTSSGKRRPSVLSAIKTLIYQSLLFAVALLPTPLAYRLACIIGQTRYRRRGDASRRLARAMQSRLSVSSRESEEWTRRYFELEAWDEVETWHCRRAGRSKIRQLLEFEGIENLDQALAAGKGAVLCAAHFRGLFILMMALAERGYKLNAIRRKPLGRQNRIGRWFNDQTTLIRHGACNFLWMEPDNLKVAIHAGAALRRNEVVLVLIDGRFAAQSVDVTFMGQTVAIPFGPMVIARTTGSPLLNLSLRLDHHGQFRHFARIGPPFYPSADVAASVQHCMSELEGAIVQDPANWIWFEDRIVWNGHERS